MSYRFLCGADMEPAAVRAVFPRARFVARARLLAADGATADEVWGILLELPADPAEDRSSANRRVVTDDGRSFEALGEAVPTGDPAATLAAARYWELPPAYVRSLPGWSDPGDGG